MNIGSNLIMGVFREYILARRELYAVLERCALKGWPDRAKAIHLSARLQELFCDQELERLKYLIANSEDGTLDSYTRIGRIRERLCNAWSDADERTLAMTSPEYSAIQAEIESDRALLDSTALEGPFEMAKRDAEMIEAGKVFTQVLDALDHRLSHRTEIPPDRHSHH